MKAQTALAISVLVLGGAATLLGSVVPSGQTGIWMGVGPAPHSAAVKNVPFSANVVVTNDHAEGKPGLKTEFHGQVARNSQGSTYFAMEHFMPTAETPRPMHITVSDPANHTVTTIDPQSKQAFISHVNESGVNASQALAPASTTSAGMPMAGQAPGVNTKIEQLGTKTMDGLQVTGVRTTRTVSPTAAGGKPFVSTVETWTSPELNIVVLMENQTSNGDRHVTRLENLVRTEPSSSLFQIPEGYSVHENTPRPSNNY